MHCHLPSCPGLCWVFREKRKADCKRMNRVSSVQLLGRVQLFVTPWTAACLAIAWSLLKLMSIELVMPSNHLILCCLLLILPSIFPSFRVFSKESVFCIRWPKDWRVSSDSNESQKTGKQLLGWRGACGVLPWPAWSWAGGLSEWVMVELIPGFMWETSSTR